MVFLKFQILNDMFSCITNWYKRGAAFSSCQVQIEIFSPALISLVINVKTLWLLVYANSWGVCCYKYYGITRSIKFWETWHYTSCLGIVHYSTILYGLLEFKATVVCLVLRPLKDVLMMTSEFTLPARSFVYTNSLYLVFDFFHFSFWYALNLFLFWQSTF